MKNSTKKKFAVLLAAVMAFGAAVLPTSAAEADNGQSTGDITFQAPSKPLVLAKVPTFRFGIHPISVATEEYNINGVLGTATPGVGVAPADIPGIDDNLQVQDMRGLATPAGWKVSVGLSKFQSSSVDSLAGAQLELASTPAAGVVNAVATITTGKPTASNNVTLPSDGTTTLTYATATLGNGSGGWTISVPDASLHVFGNSTVGNHRATLTWSLIDAP